LILTLFQCSTGNPCTECAAHNRECIYDEAADKRRKAFTKQTQEQLRYYQGLWEDLLHLIRYSDRDHLNQLIGAIRGGTTNEEVEAMVNRSSGGTRRTNVTEEALGDEMEEGSEAMSGVMEGSTALSQSRPDKSRQDR
jgi:hypothetical protein